MTFKSATLTAPCKINLYLEIVDARQDGYHELNTLFLPVNSPCDTLELQPADGFSLSCPGHESIEGADNLVAKAWKAFGEATGFAPGIHIILNKGIPMGAGLGGGSTDAAALLRWLNANAGDAAMDEPSLIELAASLGADVPFFLKGRAAWAKGIGEKLTEAEIDLHGCGLLVANPGIHVNTAWAFGEWDRTCLPQKTNPKEGLTTGNDDTKNSFPTGRMVVSNDFEAAVFGKHATIRKLKELFLHSGASAAAMSGSGSSVFAIFRFVSDMKRAAAKARKLGNQVWENSL